MGFCLPTVYREGISGFDLYLIDGTAVTLDYGDAGFDQVAEELSEQGVALALGPAKRK
jgi:hypothetical protein